jgi:hypothetical protein
MQIAADLGLTSNFFARLENEDYKDLVQSDVDFAIIWCAFDADFLYQWFTIYWCPASGCIQAGDR